MFATSGLAQASTVSLTIYGTWYLSTPGAVSSGGSGNGHGYRSVLVTPYNYTGNGSLGFDIRAVDSGYGSNAVNAEVGFTGTFDCDLNVDPQCYGDSRVTFQWAISWNYTAIQQSNPGDPYDVWFLFETSVTAPGGSQYLWEAVYQPLYAWGSNATIQQPSGLNYSVFEMTINLLNPPGPGLNGGCIGAGSPYQGVWVWTAIIQGGVSVISSSAMVRGEVNLGSGNGAPSSNNAGAALQAVTLSGACT